MYNFQTARENMIDCQIRTADVTELALIKAFRTVSRENFVPKAQQALSYGDAHVICDESRVMLRPRDLAKLVQACDIKPTDVVLDIASGRGYSAAILAQLAETVIGLETDDNMAARATSNLTEAGIDNAVIVTGDMDAGAKEHGPFDVIFVNGAVSQVPKAWKDQLSDGGRLAVVTQAGPVGNARVMTRSGNHYGERVIFDTSIPALAGVSAPAEEFSF